MTTNKKNVLPVLFSLPVVEKMELPARAELLPQIESGELDHLDFRANVFGTGAIRNPYVFLPADLPAFCASFEGQPYLRNHDSYDIASRDGTILASNFQDGIFVQDIRLTTRRGMIDFLEGRMDRFSIGWDYDQMLCTICGADFYGAGCQHWPGRTYRQTDGTDKTCELLFINPRGKETSAVNVPAVEGTGIVAALELKHEIMLAALSERPVDPPAQDGAANGQEPDAGLDPENALAQVRQESDGRRLALASQFIPGETMSGNIRELLSKRAGLLAEARKIHDLADSELRDLSAEERQNFGALMGQVETLAESISALQDERERLSQAESVLASKSSEPQRPDGQAVKTLTRVEFDALSHSERAIYARGGGKVTD